jgi:hypothetical protein
MQPEARNIGSGVRGPGRLGALPAAGCWLLTAGLWLPWSALAAEPATTQPALLQRQQDVRQRMQQLESRMALLARVLAESEPDKADRLRSAMDLYGQKQIKRRLDEIVLLVKSGDYSAAERAQAGLLTDLEAILQQLQDTGSDFDRKRAERERLERLKGGLRTLMRQQLEQLYKTQAAEPHGELIRRLREQADALQRLAERQGEMRKQPAAAGQQELAQDAEQRAGELEKLRSQTKPAETAAALEESAGQTLEAAAKMRAAAEKLEADDLAQAGQDQQAAEEQLRRIVRRLQDQAQRLAEQAQLHELEQQQRTIGQGAAGLEKELSPPPGKHGPGTPGQRNVGNARRNMQEAAERLGEERVRAAEGEEEAALEQLQRALDELDDALRQVRREELEETLTALEARFKSMLARQRRIRENVVALQEKGAEAWERTDQLKLTETAQTQHAVASDCAEVVRILISEGTTVLLPELSADLAHTMENLAARLDQADTSGETQRKMAEVIAALEEVVGAIETRRKQELQNMLQLPDQGGESANPALLPESAELRLLRSAQVRINRRTEELAAAGQNGSSGGAAELAALAARQQRLVEIARQMNERR